MISIPPPETIVSVASLSATIFYQINSDRKHMLYYIASSLFHTVVSVIYERYMVSVEYFLKLFKVTTRMVVNGVKYSEINTNKWEWIRDIQNAISNIQNTIILIWAMHQSSTQCVIEYNHVYRMWREWVPRLSNMWRSLNVKDNSQQLLMSNNL